MQIAKLALASSVAGLALWLVVGANVQRACVLEEAPYLSLCSTVPAPGSFGGLTEVRRRIAANPGDATAYASLSQLPEAPDRPALLRAASAVAPNDPNVIRSRAVVALEENRLDDAAADLVQLTEYYHHLTQDPARTLARMIAGGHAELLREHLKPGSRWFALVLSTMVELKVPVAAASPLLPLATQSGALPAERVGEFIRRLKGEGSWIDAYGLWLGQHDGRAPILYNAGFDEGFQPDGFDWEIIPARAGREGASIETRPLSGRGQVLEVTYTGRAMPTPIVRQHLLLGPGRYRLSGQFMASKLRTDSGLAWTVRCTLGATQQPIGKSTGLMDTAGQWRPFDFEIDVPANCGPVASLQLETFAPYEAAAGIRGKAYFDAFSLRSKPQ